MHEESKVVSDGVQQCVKVTSENVKTEYNNKESTKNNSKETSVYVIESFGENQSDGGNFKAGNKKNVPDCVLDVENISPKHLRGGGGGGANVFTLPPTEGEAFYYEDPKTRNSFVRKVMVILFVMLSVTTAVCIIVNAVESVRDIFREFHMIFLICSSILVMIMHYVFTCGNCARSPPCSWISLFLLNAATSFLVATVTCQYLPHILIISFAATAAVVFVCFLLALTSFDFTKFVLFVVVGMVVLAVVSMILLIVQLAMGIQMTIAQMVISAIGAVLQSVMIVIELQMILGGKSVELGVDEYILGAYMLYTSIINLFLDILRIAALSDS